MRRPFVFLSSALVALGGCAVGPDYHRPDALNSQPLPDTFAPSAKFTDAPDWKMATPLAQLPRGPWWEVFHDAELDRLEKLVAAQNQDLAAALAQFEQARALVGVARASLLPQLDLPPNGSRQRTSANAPSLGHAQGFSTTYNAFNAPLDLSWELDLWGRIRRQTESAQAQMKASAEDLESVRLGLQAELAADYFTVRALDAERRLVADTIQTYRRSLALMQNRRRGGIVSDLDVSQAETQLRTTEAELPDLDLQRARSRHAIATLIGQSATAWDIADLGYNTNACPALPAMLPSELLERRPDIAAAERRMAAANANIGVAKGAYYPRIFLNGMAGFQSVSASTWFDWPSRLWAIGPALDLPLFTGGRLGSQLAASRAAYDQNVAEYRKTVLTAFQEVEDELAAQSLLAKQLDAENAAWQAARHTLEIADNRYNAGLVTYLEVATAQSAALDSERSVAQLQGQRFVAAVDLIKALGGGWEPAK